MAVGGACAAAARGLAVAAACQAAALRFIVFAAFVPAAFSFGFLAAFLPTTLNFCVRAAFFAGELPFLGIRIPLLTGDVGRRSYNAYLWGRSSRAPGGGTIRLKIARNPLSEDFMSQKTFSLVAALIFLFVAVMHAVRLALGWRVTFCGWPLPTWLSWVALVIAGFLAYEGFKLSRHRWRIKIG